MTEQKKPRASSDLRFRARLSPEHRALFAEINSVRPNFRGRRLVQLAEFGLAVMQAKVDGNIGVLVSPATELVPRRSAKHRKDAQPPPEQVGEAQATHGSEHYQVKPTATQLVADALSGSGELTL